MDIITFSKTLSTTTVLEDDSEEQVETAPHDTGDPAQRARDDGIVIVDQATQTSDPSDPSATLAASVRDASADPSESEASFRNRLIEQDDKGKWRRLIESRAAEIIASEWQHQRIFDAKAQCWLAWQGSHWEPLIGSEVDRQLDVLIREGTGIVGYRIGYLTGIRSVICVGGLLPPPTWPTNVVPFRNGLLNLDDGVLYPAVPDFALTWCLPHQYQANADCPNIKAWLMRAVGDDAATVQFLRAWLAALVRGIALQQLLILIGCGGSGKGVFQRLAAFLIGIQNTAITTLRDLEVSQFETAKLVGKRLCMINEAGRYGGSLNKLKAITGHDHLRIERKHQQQQGSFVFDGLVLIVTNEPIASTDKSSGLERRRMTVRFPTAASPAEKADWRSRGGEEGVLHAEIAGLLNWVLDVPIEEIHAQFASPPPQVAAENRLGLAAGNSVADWMLENCIPVQNDTVGVQIGKKTTGKLYTNYLIWCDETGRTRPAPSKKFSEIVIEMGRYFGHDLVKNRHPNTRLNHIHGLRLRADNEDLGNWTDAPMASEESGTDTERLEPS